MIAPAKDEPDDMTMISTTGSTTTTNNATTTTTTLVYIPSDDYAWLPARLLSTTRNEPTLSTTTKSQRPPTGGTTTTPISTKTITVAVTRPPLPSDEPRLGLPSSSTAKWPEHVETLTVPENMVLPLQNIPPHEQQENPVTDLADLPFLHEVRK